MKKNNSTIISSQTKQDLIKLSKKLKRLPVKRDDPLLYNKVVRDFGSWNKGLLAVFGKINMLYKSEKQAVIDEILTLYMQDKKIPKASENERLVRLARTHFGSWNKALKSILGEVNQNRYGPDIHKMIITFIKKYQRLPLREEFNGKEWPYWESVTTTLGVKKWSDIFTKIDLKDIKYYYNTKHGYGLIFIYKGVTYLSREEYLIGKYLTDHFIKFEKEVPYGNANFLFDFYLIDYNVYIEYYGITTKDYKIGIENKRKKYNGRTVIEIFKHDNTIKKLALEVQRL